jgi:hypothetical protein
MHCGAKYALLWLLQGTLCRLLKVRLLHICLQEEGRSRKAGAPAFCPPPGYALRLATEAELMRGVPDDPTFPDWPSLQWDIARGDLMIAAFHGGQIVSYGWCSTRPAAIGGDLVLSLGPRFVYGHRAYTVHRHRGKGLHAAIILYSRSVAAEQGKIVVAYIDANNHKSLISESRVGRLRSGLVVVSQHGGKLRYWATPLCRRVGLTLKQEKKTPDRVGRHVDQT